MDDYDQIARYPCKVWKKPKAGEPLGKPDEIVGAVTKGESVNSNGLGVEYNYFTEQPHPNSIHVKRRSQSKIVWTPEMDDRLREYLTDLTITRPMLMKELGITPGQLTWRRNLLLKEDPGLGKRLVLRNRSIKYHPGLNTELKRMTVQNFADKYGLSTKTVRQWRIQYVYHNDTPETPAGHAIAYRLLECRICGKEFPARRQSRRKCDECLVLKTYAKKGKRDEANRPGDQDEGIDGRDGEHFEGKE